MQIRIIELIILFLCFINISLSAQENKTGTVSGYVFTIEENGEKNILPLTSIVVLHLPDSVFVCGSVTNEQGYFNFKYPIIKDDFYLLKISCIGMKELFYTLKGSKEKLKNIILENANTSLDEVLVIAKLPEVQQKKDTTIVNATAFVVSQNAYLKELIKKIPGIVYEEDNGKLSYNGRTIQEINVNGEPFFNKDTRMALNNLPAKFVSKIRIYSKQDDSSFNRINNKHYVLDLQTKEEFNGSILSSLKGGYGTNKKKDFEGQVNYFKEKGDNLSLILHSTNKDLNSLYDGNIAHSLGLNVFNKFSREFNIRGNIQYKINKNGNKSSNYAEQYLQYGNLYSLGNSENENANRLLNSSIGMEWKPNDKTTFLINASYDNGFSTSINHNNTFVLNHPINLTESELNDIPEEYKINSNFYKSQLLNKTKAFNWQAMIMRDISEYIRIDFNFQYNQNEGRNQNVTNSAINYYRIENDKDSLFNSNQYVLSPSDNTEWNTSLTLFQSINENIILQYFYGWNLNKEDTQRNTYDLSNWDISTIKKNQLPSDYKTGYIDSLSNSSRSKKYAQNIGFYLNYNSEQWNARANLTYSPLWRNINQQTGILRTDTIIHSADIQSALSISWNKDNLNISLSYDGFTNQPSLTTLLPVANISNPLNVFKGNPDLKRSFTHSINLDLIGFSGFWSSIGYQRVSNDITQNITYNAITGGRVSSPVNINGNWNIRTNFQWSKKIGNFNLRINENISYRNQVSLIGNIENTNTNRSKTKGINALSRLSFGYQPKWGEVELLGEHCFIKNHNSLHESNVYSRDYKIRLNGLVNLSKIFQVLSDMSYTFRSGTAIEKSNNSELLWNVGASLFLLRNKSAELSFYWADILKQKKDYIRNVTSDSFYEYHTQQLPGYILLSLKYNFNF